MVKVTTTVEKRIEKYDNAHYAVYLNKQARPLLGQEEQVSRQDGESAATGVETQAAYDYDMLLVSSDGEPTKGDVVNAIIRTRYTESDEMAIQRHYLNDREGYETEWREYNAFCEWAKAQYGELAGDTIAVE